MQDVSELSEESKPEVHFDYGIPIRCGVCAVPMGYIITNIGTPLARFLNEVSSMVCEQCFNKKHQDELQ